MSEDCAFQNKVCNYRCGWRHGSECVVVSFARLLRRLVLVLEELAEEGKEPTDVQ